MIASRRRLIDFRKYNHERMKGHGEEQQVKFKKLTSAVVLASAMVWSTASKVKMQPANPRRRHLMPSRKDDQGRFLAKLASGVLAGCWRVALPNPD